MSDDTQREAFRRAMSEASVLPPGDPQRRPVETQVATAGEWAQREWLALLEEEERLRLALRGVEVPDDLEQRLLAIPEETGRRKGFWSRLRRAPFWTTGALAAAILLAIGLALFSVARHRAGDLQTLAELAMRDHLTTHALAIQTHSPSHLQAGLSGKLPFAVTVPNLGSAFRLRGGRPCKLAGHPVAYTSWEGPSGRYSLCQFRREDFRLTNKAIRTVIQPKDPTTQRPLCEALICTCDDYGFILVGEAGSALDRISPQSN